MDASLQRDAAQSLAADSASAAAPGQAAVASAPLATAVLESLAAHLCVLAEDGTVLWVNRAWRQFAAENSGRPELTCEGSNYLNACRPAEELSEPSPQELPEHLALGNFTGALREVLAGRRLRAEVEYPCHSPSEQRWFVVEATAMNGPGAARAVVAHHPITLRRLADMRQREELRLQALGTLASGIAHDFNNLLSVILGRSRMLAEDLGPAHFTAVHIDALRTAAGRATSLVAKILAFGRGETGEPRAQDLAPVVRDALELFRAGLPGGVRLAVQIDPGPLVAAVDATELTQIVLNLCRNAADALPQGHGEITVRLRAVEEPGPAQMQLVELAVADNGVGIDARLRERIFEPFFSTKPRGQGTGLGLAIVHGIVNRLGGRISVQSTPGQGSRFDIRLPRLPAAAADEPAAAGGTFDARAAAFAPALAASSSTAATSATAVQHTCGVPVLLVDDDEVVGLAVEAFLQRAGCVPHRYSQAPEALSDLLGAPGRFGLVITDHTMPGLTGLELAREVSARAPALPVVLMSGYIDDKLQADALAAGVRAVMRKERLYDELLPLLARLLAPAAA